MRTSKRPIHTEAAFDLPEWVGRCILGGMDK